MIVFRTVQTIFILFSHVGETIVKTIVMYNHCEATSHQLHWYLTCFWRISIWHAPFYPIEPSIWHYTKNRFSHILSSLAVFSYQYNHCEAISQQLHWCLINFFEYFNMTCFLLPNRSLIYKFNWDQTQPCMIMLNTIP